MSNLNLIFRYFRIKKIEIRDITDVIDNFEENIVKDKAQLIRKTKKHLDYLIHTKNKQIILIVNI